MGGKNKRLSFILKQCVLGFLFNYFAACSSVSRVKPDSLGFQPACLLALILSKLVGGSFEALQNDWNQELKPKRFASYF